MEIIKNTEKILDAKVLSDIDKKMTDTMPKSQVLSQMLADYEDNRYSKKFSEAELEA